MISNGFLQIDESSQIKYYSPMSKNELELRREKEEVLESMELDGVAVERLPATMHSSGHQSWRFISPSELVGSGFSRYTQQNIAMLAKDNKRNPIHHFRIFGRIFLDAIGVLELMEHERMSLEGKLGRGMRIGEYRGGGPKPHSGRRPLSRPPIT